MNLQRIKPDMLAVLGGSSVLLTGLTEVKKFVNGSATNEPDGYRAEVVCDMDRSYEKLTVKLESNPTITQAEIQSSAAPIRVTFSGFEAKFYRKDFKSESWALSCKAKSMQIVNSKTSQ